MTERKICIQGKEFCWYSLNPEAPYFKDVTVEYREPQLEMIIEKCVPRDGVCLDIGANIGLITLMLAANTNAKGKVYAFEAGKDNYSQLAHTISQNDFKNVIPVQIAVGEKNCMVNFLENTRYGFINNEGDGDTLCLNIDTFYKLVSPDRLDFIKIDVEGFKWSVLKGGLQTINAFNPLIYLEFNTLCILNHTHDNPRLYLEWLFANFKYIGLVNHKTRDFNKIVSLCPKEKMLHILSTNILQDRSVSDLVITNNDNYARQFLNS